MQFTTTTLLTSTALILPTALAGTASVSKACSYPVYVNSAGNTIELAAGSGAYSEPIDRAGAALILSNDASLASPLTFEYSLADTTVYYDISNNAGNPFAGENVTLDASDSACAGFDCVAGDADCFSSAASSKIKACAAGTDLAVTLCG